MSQDPNTEMLVFNGLDGSKGSYLVDPLTLSELRDRAFNLMKNRINFRESDDHLRELMYRSEQGKAAYDLRKDAVWCNPKVGQSNRPL